MFSDKIRELMIERDISLTDLAELSGVPFETLRNIYYRKVKDPKVSTAFQLASALEVTVEYLLKDMSTDRGRGGEFRRTGGHRGRTS